MTCDEPRYRVARPFRWRTDNSQGKRRFFRLIDDFTGEVLALNDDRTKLDELCVKLNAAEQLMAEE